VRRLCSAFRRGLRHDKWSNVNRVLLDLTPQEWDANDAAAKLARNLVVRMTTKLTENPKVTARALWPYDREMYAELIEALKRHTGREVEAERDLEEQVAQRGD
jgi:hypothetical protein